jgi:hypothetical protein
VREGEEVVFGRPEGSFVTRPPAYFWTPGKKGME